MQRVPVPTQAVQSSLEPQDRRVGAPSVTAELSRTREISINQPDSFKTGAKIRKDPLFEVMLLLVISIPGGIFFSFFTLFPAASHSVIQTRFCVSSEALAARRR